MTKRKIKSSAYPILYGLLISFIIGGLFLIDNLNANLQEADPDYDYVSKTIFDNVIPVVGKEKITIIKPYTNENVQILTNFYDKDKEAKEQEKSLILYEGTYIPSTGVSYGMEEEFDVVAVLKGTVIEVKEDQILGNIVKIRHDNDLISVYQSLSAVNVKQDDAITQGQIIGKSGSSNLQKDLKNHVHFELIKNGMNVNPEEYFGKNIDEL